MKSTAQSRELIELDNHDIVIRGTWHKARGWNNVGGSNRADPSRLGIVFLNSMSSTRAAFGDGAVDLADALAECGHSVFRLDLPGFGDSDGDPPQDLMEFVNCGGFASIAAAKISELSARFQLTGVILQGHCAGAVSAIFTARVCKECRGLMLMAPYFHLPQIVRSKARQQLSKWALRSKVGGRLSGVFDQLKAICQRWRPAKLPDNANVALLRSWKEVANSGIPILVVVPPDRKSNGVQPRLGEFDYISHLGALAGRQAKLAIEAADGADHSFSNRVGRVAIREITRKWLSCKFGVDSAAG